MPRDSPQSDPKKYLPDSKKDFKRVSITCSQAISDHGKDGGFWKSDLQCFSGQSWTMKPDEVKRKLLKQVNLNNEQQLQAKKIKPGIRNGKNAPVTHRDSVSTLQSGSVTPGSRAMLGLIRQPSKSTLLIAN